MFGYKKVVSYSEPLCYITYITSNFIIFFVSH